MKTHTRLAVLVAAVLLIAVASTTVAQAATPVKAYMLKANADRYAVYNNSRNGLVMVNNVTSWKARLTSSYLLKNTKGANMLSSFKQVYSIVQYYYAQFYYDASTKTTRNFMYDYPFVFRAIKGVTGTRQYVSIQSYSHPAFKIPGTVSSVDAGDTDIGDEVVTVNGDDGKTSTIYLSSRPDWTAYYDANDAGQSSQDWASALSAGDRVVLYGVVDGGQRFAYAGAR